MIVPKAEREFHRKMGRRCFNEAWEYLEMKGREVPEDQRMLQLVHASAYHWSIVGTPENQAVSDWQISRAYASLKSPQLALEFARSSLRLCEKQALTKVLGTAYEAMARAHAAAKDFRSAREYIVKAKDQLSAAAMDAEDRKIYLGQICDTEKLIRRGSAKSPTGSD